MTVANIVKTPRKSSCSIVQRNFSFSLNTLWQDQASPLEMSVLGHLETGNPKNVTQQDSTQRLQNCLIGRCKDMMSSMDPTKALGTQEEAAETSLVTRKFSSSIFCWKELYKSQEGESKNTKEKSRSLYFGASGNGLSPAFYSYKETCLRRTRELTVHVSWTHS